MHLVITFGAVTLITIVGVVWVIGVAIGHNTAKRQAEKIRLKMEVKQARLSARAESRAQRKIAMQKFLPWRRP